MKLVVELDPNLGKDFKEFFSGVFDSSVKTKNILLGIFVGSILLGGTIIMAVIIVYVLNLIFQI